MDDTDAQMQSYWPELEELARPARERRRLAPETRSEIILQLCAKAPLSVKELSELLDRSEAYVGDAIRPLVTGGDLTFLFPDQPRHPRQKYITGKKNTAPTPVPPPMPVPLPPPVPEIPRPHERYAPPAVPAPVPESAPPLRPAPAPANPPFPATATATAIPAYAPLDEPPVEERRAPRFPNQLTNIASVIAVGLVLALTSVSNWWIVALIAAAALSAWHLTVESAQYRRFRTLQPRRNRRVAFVVLKSMVTLAEIVVVYFVTLAL